MKYNEMTDKELNILLTGYICDCMDWELSDDESVFYHCGIDGSQYVVQAIIKFMCQVEQYRPVIYSFLCLFSDDFETNKVHSDYELNCMCAPLCLPCDYIFNDDDKTVDCVGETVYLGAHGMPYERLEKFHEFNPLENKGDFRLVAVNFLERLEQAND